MENETLEELIARWRRSVAPDGGYNSQETTSASYDVVRLNCADELAPILAGLRELRDKWRMYRVEHDTIVGIATDACADELTFWLGQPATADQTGR